ncbi:MAG: amino acid decarboxylase, partial [Gemmatimonadetes bacterium]|nr:amino acid decarboxylase [Gemmatimonadota bacterium]
MREDWGGIPRTAPLGDMPLGELQPAAAEVAEWITGYLTSVADYPVLARVRPGEIRSSLPPRMPETGESFPAIFRDFGEQILPGVTHWNHPGFFAYFSITGSAPGVLGEMLASALNINAMVWRSSPVGTELEEHVLAWLRDLLGLPEVFDGTINDTASSSSLYALAAAREAKLPETRDHGLCSGPRCRFYTSEQSHASIDKAVITLGFGRKGIRKIPTDDAFRMDPKELRRAVREDLANGIRPLGIVATLGTTSTTSVDPVAEIGEIAREHGLWLHVDAAYGGPAAAVSELRPLFTGWEEADSIVVNPHKWLFTPIDCSVLYVQDPAQLKKAFSLTPEYLKTSEADASRNLMDYGMSLGRRFRSLKLWFVLRYFGAEGIRDRIRQHVEMARSVASWIDADEDWERVAPVPFSTVVLRYAPDGRPGEDQDRINRAIMDRVNESGEFFLSHTVLKERFCIRMAIGNLRTRWEHLERCWAL